MSRKNLSWWDLSITGISQLLWTQCWPNFKGRFREPSITDANRYGGISPANICPYQEYLSCYWLYVDETSKVGSKKIYYLNFFRDVAFYLNILYPQFLCPKCFCTHNCFWTQKCFWPKIIIIALLHTQILRDAVA